MNFAQRLKFYLIGFAISFFFLMILFSDKMFSCSYFPNDRVLAEIKTKSLEFSNPSKVFLTKAQISTKFITDSALVKGKIDFKKSNAQNLPCPYYLLNYKNLEIHFTKCKDKVVIDSINKTR